MDTQLLSLIDDYWNTPSIGQPQILKKINARRKRLKMPPVDSRLQETVQTVVAVKEKPKLDHSEAEQIYRRYQQRKREMQPHLDYAERVSKATHSPGMTPVEPLATMGCGGGPLLCDVCRKPMLLEGGKFNKVFANIAWKQNPERGWKSWISGGMVVEVVENGTLRIYHGYPSVKGHCCTIGKEQRDNMEAAYIRPDTAPILKKLELFFGETGEVDWGLLNDIINTLYSYDPGIGVNRPE
jgi:hypothetical protein